MITINGQTIQELELEMLKRTIRDYIGGRLLCHSVSMPLMNGSCAYCTYEGLNCARLINIRENVK